MPQDQRAHKVLDRLSNYSNESLLKELIGITEIVGRTSLRIADIEKHGRCCYEMFKQHFGGLNAALYATGLTDKEFHRNVSDEQLLGELARIWDIVLTHEGRRPYKNDLVKYKSRYSHGHYYRRWGSWKKACEALLAWESKPNDGLSLSTSSSEVANPAPLSPKRKRPIPLRIRYAILLRDRFTCQSCGRSPSSTPGLLVDVDHKVPESQGGTLDHSNLRCLCQEYNLGKGAINEF